MKKIAVLPARYAASRFPGKLMQLLGNKTVIASTYEATKATGLFDEVIVATDSNIIKEEIENNGGRVLMTRSDHESGTDRIAEAVSNLDVAIIVNVQGDTPFVNKKALEDLLNVFDDPKVSVASLMDVIQDEASLNDPNVVKVVVDKNNNSLFFSRSVLPYPRNPKNIVHYRHIGVYAFRKEMLLQFTQWEIGPLEDAEKLEGLRYLENGVQLKMVVTEPIGVDINTPEDLQKANASLQQIGGARQKE